MSILSDFEDRVSSAVEGMFAGVFRAPVQPAELARACAKEMDRRKKLGVGKVYAPNVYSILLSPRDGDQLGGFAETLAGELSTYLVSYAAQRDYLLSSKPLVRFLVDDGLKLGRFEVIGELLSAQELEALKPQRDDTFWNPDADEPSSDAAVQPSPAPIDDLAAPLAATPAVAPVPLAPVTMPPAAAFFDADEHLDDAALIATVTVPGVAHDIVLRGDRMVIGRLKACDVCLPDVNASREHAALEPEGAGWVIEDLGSTNGTRVNGEKVTRMRLRDGDVIGIGISELVFHETRG